VISVLIPPYTVQIVDWVVARPWAVPIRMQVFVEEQRVPAEVELDEMDATSEHAIARSAAGEVIATGRLLPDGHIGRMAVVAAWRGHGVGRAMLDALMTRATVRGVTCVVLAAQLHAVKFYVKSGFVPRGAMFMDAGIEHIEMIRAL
jgi:predicted GNAT family N-acyltransferase